MSTREYNYSSLSQAYQCQQLYKYTYIDMIKPDVNTNGDLAFGSAMHFALEQYFTEGLDPLPEFNIYWDTVKAQNLTYGRFKHDDLSTQAEVLLSRFIRLHAKKIVAHTSEKELHGSLGSPGSLFDLIDIRGTPDLLGDYNDIPSVIDFKTSGYRYHKGKTALSEQMYLYAHLAEQVLQYDARQLVYFVFIKGKEPSIQVLTKDIGAAHMQFILKNVSNQISELENKKTYTRNTNNCIRGEIVCAFYNKCWKE